MCSRYAGPCIHALLRKAQALANETTTQHETWKFEEIHGDGQNEEIRLHAKERTDLERRRKNGGGSPVVRSYLWVHGSRPVSMEIHEGNHRDSVEHYTPLACLV